MNERDFRAVLQEALLLYMEEEPPFAIRDVRTFREAGVLSTNEGLVVRTEDGSEFHLTIVKSR